MEVLKKIIFDTPVRGNKLKYNEMRLHYNGKNGTSGQSNNSITINGVISKKLKERNLNFLAVNENNLTGEFYFTFKEFKEHGDLKVNHYNNHGSFYSTVSGRQLMNYIVNKLQIDEKDADNKVIHISETQKIHHEFLTYVINI